MFDLAVLRSIAQVLSARLMPGELDERGEVTEKVLTTAIFAALAIAAGAIIVTKVTTRANEIPTK